MPYERRTGFLLSYSDPVSLAWTQFSAHSPKVPQSQENPTSNMSPPTKKSTTNATATGGTIVAYVKSKKFGASTPVRRSMRNANDNIDSASKSWLDNMKSPSPNKTCGTVATVTDAVGLENTVVELCTMFSVNININDASLEVRAKGTPSRVSPMPDAGRYTGLIDGRRELFSPVKRCIRNSTENS